MKVAVIGAGISGLCAAYELADAGVEVVLYEKEDRLGGDCRSVTIEDIDLDLGFLFLNQ
ncbi:Protoporphyrinogen oxidase 2, chloroplastic/mitochondrial-like protein, partial [Drosera capensis]